MDRLKQLEDRVLRPNLNRTAARNFVRSAMFDPQAPSASNEDDQEENQFTEIKAQVPTADSCDAINVRNLTFIEHCFRWWCL